MNHERSIPRKPVPDGNSTNRQSFDSMPESSTIRMVPSGESVPSHTDLDGYGADDLAPALSKMDLGESSDSNRDSGVHITSSSSPTHHRIPRKSLDKPLPETPSNRDRDVQHIDRRSDDAARSLERDLGAEGVVDLSHTEDTTVYERMAPAVTHETVIHDIHEIRHEQRTRDIHEYHHHHRILPIVDIEVKPARHFFENSYGKRTEIPEDQIPGRNTKHTQRVIEEVYKDMLPKNKTPPGPRRFTARDFAGSQGDDWEHETPEGVKLTEKWWVHPPTLETGGRDSGQTVPFHLGSSDPADDGIRP